MHALTSYRSYIVHERNFWSLLVNAIQKISLSPSKNSCSKVPTLNRPLVLFRFAIYTCHMMNHTLLFPHIIRVLSRSAYRFETISSPPPNRRIGRRMRIALKDIRMYVFWEEGCLQIRNELESIPNLAHSHRNRSRYGIKLKGNDKLQKSD